jgi:hypothetical protein
MRSWRDRIEAALPIIAMALWFGGCFVVSQAILGCASVVVVGPTGGAVEVRPGLRNLSVCFGDDGRPREVKAYPLSPTFALQNTALGALLGAAVGAAFGIAPVGAAVGAGAGLVSDALRALGGIAGTAASTPSCDYPAPPLKPDEAEITPPRKREVLLPAERLSRFPAVWPPVARWHETP